MRWFAFRLRKEYDMGYRLVPLCAYTVTRSALPTKLGLGITDNHNHAEQLDKACQ